MAVFVGTERGLAVPGTQLAGHAIRALAADGSGVVALCTDGDVWQARGPRWHLAGHLEKPAPTCLLPTPDGLLVGTEEAHLFRIDSSGAHPEAGFDAVPSRSQWYTPWGAPAGVRSLTADTAGRVYVNVHVGGVVRRAEDLTHWQQTSLDIDVDVHQVLAHPLLDGVVLAATGEGLATSRDAGDTWHLDCAGLHGRYLRAVAIADEYVLVSAADSFRGERVALYRRPLEGDRFERCTDGLAGWFPGHIDTGRLSACGAFVAAGAPDGTVFVSTDAGLRWRPLGVFPDLTCLLAGG